MKIAEPMTVFTDYLISGQIIILSYFLLSNKHSSTSQIFWIIGFGFIGLGALFGGTSHGFKEYFSGRTNFIIWKLTTLSVGFGSFFTLLGSIGSSIRNDAFRNFMLILSVVSLTVYVVRMRTHHEFIDLVIYYLPLMITILFIKLISWYNWDDPSSLPIIFAIGITLAGSIIQVLKIGLHEHFNHNDIFHLIQMVGIYFFYLGIKELNSLL